MKIDLFSSYKGLPQSIYILFLVQVVNRFGDFVLPFLTLLLVGKLGYKMGPAGFIVMLCALAVIPGAFAGGKLSDSIGRKKAYILFQSSSAILLFICGFVGTSKLLVVLVICSAFFSGGVRPILSAMISDILPPHQRQAGFSLSYLGINLGVALGPMVAGFLFNHNLPLLFIGDAISSFLAIALVMKYIGETKPTDETKHHSELEKSETGNIFTVLMKRPRILLFFAINILFSIVYSQHTFSVPIKLNADFIQNGPVYFGYMMSLNAVTVLLLTLPLNNLTKNLKPLTCLSLSGLFYAVGFGMIGIINSVPLYAVSTIIWTMGEILAVTSFGVYLANNSPQNFRARINAVSSLFFALGSALGTSGVGYFVDRFSLNAIWPMVFILGIIGAVGMQFLKIEIKKTKTNGGVI